MFIFWDIENIPLKDQERNFIRDVRNFMKQHGFVEGGFYAAFAIHEERPVIPVLKKLEQAFETETTAIGERSKKLKEKTSGIIESLCKERENLKRLQLALYDANVCSYVVPSKINDAADNVLQSKMRECAELDPLCCFTLITNDAGFSSHINHVVHKKNIKVISIFDDKNLSDKPDQRISHMFKDASQSISLRSLGYVNEKPKTSKQSQEPRKRRGKSEHQNKDENKITPDKKTTNNQPRQSCFSMSCLKYLSVFVIGLFLGFCIGRGYQ